MRSWACSDNESMSAPTHIWKNCCTQASRVSTSIGKYLSASDDSIKTLNKKLRDPEKVLYALGLYECTMNDPDPLGHYNQSSLALLLDLPPRHTVESFQPISMWIAPAGTMELDFTSFHNG
jgi:hypothetical protein